MAAGAGAFGVSEWLLQQGAVVNAVDNFKRTPLEVNAWHPRKPRKSCDQDTAFRV